MSDNGGLVINDDTIKDDSSGIAPWKILIADDDDQFMRSSVFRTIDGK